MALNLQPVNRRIGEFASLLPPIPLLVAVILALSFGLLTGAIGVTFLYFYFNYPDKYEAAIHRLAQKEPKNWMKISQVGILFSGIALLLEAGSEQLATTYPKATSHLRWDSLEWILIGLAVGGGSVAFIEFGRVRAISYDSTYAPTVSLQQVFQVVIVPFMFSVNWIAAFYFFTKGPSLFVTIFYWSALLSYVFAVSQGRGWFEGKSKGSFAFFFLPAILILTYLVYPGILTLS